MAHPCERPSIDPAAVMDAVAERGLPRFGGTDAPGVPAPPALETLEPRLLLSIHVADYFPMDVGCEWNYGASADVTRRVTDVYWDGATKVATFENCAHDDEGWVECTNEEYALSDRGLELRRQWKGGYGSFHFDFNPPLLILPAEVEIGQTYDFEELNPNANTTYCQSGICFEGPITGSTKILGFENASVPAGTFRALKILRDFRTTGSNEEYGTVSTKQKVTHYWSWGLGEVKVVKAVTVKLNMGQYGRGTDSARGTLRLGSFSGLPDPLPDLVGAFGKISLPGVIVPEAGAKGRAPVVVTNEGVLAVPKDASIDIQVLARPSEPGSGLEEQDLYSLVDQPIGGLAPGKSKTFTASLAIPEDLAGGDYDLVAVIDGSGGVAESNEDNNEAVAPGMRSVPQIRGAFAGSLDVLLTDRLSADGEPLEDEAFTLNGPVSIARQTGESFTATGELSMIDQGEVAVFRPVLQGTIAPDGQVSGTFTHSVRGSGGSSSKGSGTFTGALDDNRLSLELTGQDADVTGETGTIDAGFRGTDMDADVTVRTHVLCVGVHDMPSDLAGDVAAFHVHHAFQQFDNIETNTLLQLDTFGDGNKAALIDAIEAAKQNVKPRDTFVFYFASHGGYEAGGDEAVVQAQYDPADLQAREPTTGDEYLFLSRPFDNDSILTDDDFSALFLDEAWQEVNKLFVIDTCYAGGHAGTTTFGDTGDLSRLERAGLIAAAEEGNFGWAAWSPLAGAYVHVLGSAVAGALDKLGDRPTITFADVFDVARVDGAVHDGADGRITAIQDQWDVDAKIEFVPGIDVAEDFDGRVAQVEIRKLHGARKVQYTDSDGDVVTVALKGAGTGEVILPPDARADALEVRLSGTTNASSVTVSVKRAGDGDGQTTLGGVAIDGALKSFTGKTADLVGPFAATGPVAALVLDDVDGAGTLQLNTSGAPAGASGAKITLARVADTGIDTHGLPINSLTALDWLDTDDIQDELKAAWIGKLTTKGRKANAKKGVDALAGDVQADLVLDGADRKGNSLGSASIAGGVSGAAWHLAHNAGSITVKGAVDGWQANLKGGLKSLTAGDIDSANVSVSDALGTVKAQRWGSGTLDADTIKALNITGLKGNAKKGIDAVEGTFGADLSVRGENVTKGSALGSAKIAADLTSGSWAIDGDMGKLTVGRWVLAATVMASGDMLGLTLGGTNGGEFLAGIDLDTQIFDEAGQIRSIAVKGWKVAKGEQLGDVGIDSEFWAARMGGVSVLNARDANAYRLHVLGGAESWHIKSVSYRDAGEKWTWKPGKPWPGEAGSEPEPLA